MENISVRYKKKKQVVSSSTQAAQLESFTDQIFKGEDRP